MTSPLIPKNDKQKPTETDLNTDQTRLHFVLEGAQLGYWDWNITTNEVKRNHIWAEMLGYTYEEIKNTTQQWSDFLHPDDLKRAWKSINDHLEGKTPYHEATYRMKTKDGNYKWILDRAMVVQRDKNGKPLRMSGTHSDITALKKYEEELLKIQKLESLGILAGGIAHDFNNLMGGIFGYIDLAIVEPSKLQSNEYLKMAMSTIDRARALTSQLLTFAKGGEPVQQTRPLFPLMQETILFALSGSNVSSVFNIAPDLLPCSFDPHQLSQVFDNITINAVQSMPSGGILEVHARNIVLNTNEHSFLSPGNYVKISVKDSGNGIPKELLPRIFDPFFTTKVKGHGLGLATCHSIITRHNGSIDVESELNKGTVFSIYIPAASKISSQKKSPPNHEHNGQGTFLIMDDEPVILATIGKMMESLGYNVMCAHHGAEAVTQYKKLSEENIGLSGVIFDLTVPGGMSGIEAAGRIRALNQQIPIFVISGYAEDPVMKDPAAYGFAASLCKPFKIAELAELLNNYFKTNNTTPHNENP